MTKKVKASRRQYKRANEAINKLSHKLYTDLMKAEKEIADLKLKYECGVFVPGEVNKPEEQSNIGDHA
jgi:hypothetical protein